MKYFIIIGVCFLLLGCSSNSKKSEQFRSEQDVISNTLLQHDSEDQIENNWIDPENDTDFFSSGSFLYWQTDSDSSWLTFETKSGKKTVLNTDYIGYWSQLGTNFIKEYDQYLFFMHEWISGCCTTPDFILLDKNNGKELKRIESRNAIYASGDENFILYFKDSTMNEIQYLDLTKDKTYRFNMKKFKMLESAHEIGIVNCSDFIDYPEFNGNEVSFVFNHLPKDENGKYKQDSIVFVKN